MILILILSDAIYNFVIRFVALVHYKKTCIGPKTILSVERSVCWRVGPKSVGPIICPHIIIKNIYKNKIKQKMEDARILFHHYNI